MTEEQLNQIMIELENFVHIETWSVKKKHLQQHPTLLSDEHLLVLQYLIKGAKNKEDEQAYYLFVMHYNLLIDCREKGIETAFLDSERDRQNYFQIRIDFLKQILETMHDNPDQLYSLLQTNLHLLNLNLVQTFHEVVSTVFHHQPENARFLAAIVDNFSSFIASFPLGHRADNLEIAIVGYNLISTIFTNQTYPNRWATLQNDLANVYLYRIYGERADNLEQAIDYYKLALTIRTQETFPKKWADTQKGLGNVYFYRLLGERSDNLEQAIEHFHLSLIIYTQDVFPEAWASTHINLGLAYADRIYGEKAENLEKAIECYNLASNALTRQDSPKNWAITHNNLATAYQTRIRGERTTNLKQAIEHYNLALSIYTQENFPENWAETQTNLANTYLLLYLTHGELFDPLEQAIKHYNLALNIFTEKTFPEKWATTQMNMANAYRTRRHIHGNKQVDKLDLANKHYNLALNILTEKSFPEKWAMTQTNLAATYQDMGQFDQAVKHYQNSLIIFTPTTYSHNHRLTASSLAQLHFTQQQWTELTDLYASIQQANQIILNSAYTESGRQYEVGQYGQIYGQVCYAWLKLGRYGQALTTLEQGKTRLLSEALALNEVDVSQLPREQQSAVQAKRQTVRELETALRLMDNEQTSLNLPASSELAGRSDSATERQERRRHVADQLAKARAELNELIDSIRHSHPDFMPTGLELDELLALIPVGGALVAPVVTSQGSAVFVLPHGVALEAADDAEQYIFWLDDFTTETLQAMLIGSEDEPGWVRAYLSKRSKSPQLLAAMDTMTEQLTDTLVVPLLSKLNELGIAPGSPLLYMPQGGLGLLPLHALLLENYPVSVLPSGYALHTSQQRLAHQPRQIALTAVINPTQDLPFTPVEGEAVCNLFPEERVTALWGDEAHKTAVQQLLHPQPDMATLFHFSGHGYYNWNNPLHSGLRLADERLTLNELRSNATLQNTRLVVLSACETGITEFQDAPDEFIGLPAGFLQAGTPAVISTLWAVNDLSTALLMERFYQFYLTEGLPLPEALRHTQRWLRDVTAGALAERFTAEKMALVGQTRLPQGVVFSANRRFSRDFQPDERPFAHPYYWAAFTFSGV